MAAISSEQSLILDLPPSCIQFCPTKPDLFVVGTYYLHKTEEQQPEHTSENEPAPETTAPQKRTGSLILFRLRDEKITLLHTLTTDFAILDAQWNPHPDPTGPLLAVATSTGLLALYHLDAAKEILVPSHTRTITDDPSTLVLSLTWHPLRPNILGTTLSDGRVILCVFGGTTCRSGEIRISDIHSHDLEAWTMTFTGNGDGDGILSGGDDSVLRFSQHDNHEAVWSNRKLHQAGITSLLPLPLLGNLLVTGSYDDHIRLLSLTPSHPKLLAELHLGGGVWRLKKLHYKEESTSSHHVVLLASCMHAGSRIVRLSREGDGEEDWNFKVLAKFEEHQSMNYGSDGQPGTEGNRKTIVSTSFYDKLLCLWHFDVT